MKLVIQQERQELKFDLALQSREMKAMLVARLNFCTWGEAWPHIIRGLASSPMVNDQWARRGESLSKEFWTGDKKRGLYYGIWHCDNRGYLLHFSGFKVGWNNFFFASDFLQIVKILHSPWVKLHVYQLGRNTRLGWCVFGSRLTYKCFSFFLIKNVKPSLQLQKDDGCEEEYLMFSGISDEREEVCVEESHSDW